MLVQILLGGNPPSHWQNYNTRQKMLLHRHKFTEYGMFDYEVRHFYGIKPIGQLI